MNRHSCREKAMICLYQHRLLNKPMDEIIEEVMEMKTGELDDFSRILILDTLDNENRYIQYINEAVRLAKDYCDDEAYRLINGVLDRI